MEPWLEGVQKATREVIGAVRKMDQAKFAEMMKDDRMVEDKAPESEGASKAEKEVEE